MSNLPPKPDFSRPPSTWTDSADDRPLSGPGRSTPDKYAHQRESRDDRERDRDRDGRERGERGNRSRYPPPSWSPRPLGSTDTYFAGSRDTTHGRDYRDDPRPRDDRRRDWERDRDRERIRDRDRDWDRDRDRGGYYRRPPGRINDSWTPQKDYSPGHPSSGRRGYPPRESDWRDRDDYRRERDRERGRSRDRDEQRPREREYDRRNASPTYRPAPLSPRRDYHGGAHSPPRRPQPSYPSRGRRSTSPRSTDSRSRRSSPISRARPEVVDHHPPRDTVRPPRSPSPRRRTPSPRRRSRSVSIPPRPRPESRSPVTTTRHLHPPERSPMEVGINKIEPIEVERQPDGSPTAALESRMDVEMIAEPPSKGKARVDDQDHGKVESPPSASPMELQPLIQPAETAPVPSSEQAVTQPYLPTIPRYEGKPKFSAGYETEYNRLEAHRAHAAVECRRCTKASRRAFHELEMTTLDLRAAQHRRELAESHRKKAHHGQLGIDAETVQ